MVVGLEIQYGRQNIISFMLSCHRSKICQKDSPQLNVFKLTLSQKSFYVFRKDRQCKFIFLLSPSLDLINTISVWALEAMTKPCREVGLLHRLPALIYNPKLHFALNFFNSPCFQYIIRNKILTFWEISICQNSTSLIRNDEKSDFWPWKWGVDLYTSSTFTQVNMVIHPAYVKCWSVSHLKKLWLFSRAELETNTDASQVNRK